jgi:hypothetical protein
MKIITTLLSSIILASSLGARTDEFRAKEIEAINKADGFEYIAGSRRPIKLESGIHYHGWLYNKDMDVAVIQYTHPGQLHDSHKNKIAGNILSKWKGELGTSFRKVGFKDVALMITELNKTKVYSSRNTRWYTVDEYLALRF